MRLDDAIDCADCGVERSLRDWIHDDGVCDSCGCRHVFSRIHAALRSATDGELEGWSLEEVVEEFGLSDDEAVSLLVALGVSHSAAVDIERTYLGDWPRSEWRRLIGRTRESEREDRRETREKLEEYGIETEL
ncbi:MAG: hypothetical protein SV253_03475 [Halobacteria archaeon]|nr:hypothetical protein [Halobacteria archaeon]